MQFAYFTVGYYVVFVYTCRLYETIVINIALSKILATGSRSNSYVLYLVMYRFKYTYFILYVRKYIQTNSSRRGLCIIFVIYVFLPELPAGFQADSNVYINESLTFFLETFFYFPRRLAILDLS